MRRMTWVSGSALVIAALMLSGCFSSSSSSSGGGGDDEQANGDSSGNGENGLDRDIADAEAVYFYASESALAPEAEIVAVDADYPASQLSLDPSPQDNARARQDVEIYRGTDDESIAVPTTLPLGLKYGEWEGGTVTGVHFPKVVYNGTDARLYVVDATGGEPVPRRVSGEDSAFVICAASLFPDYTDLDASVLAYQTAGQNFDCDETEWRMTTLGADESEPPIELRSSVAYDGKDGGFVPPDNIAEPGGFNPDWAVPVRDADGSIRGLITADADDAGNVLYHELDGAQTQIAAVDNFFRPLGYAGADNRLILHLDGNVKAVDPDSDTQLLESMSDNAALPTNAARVEPSLTSRNHAVHAEGILYVLDLVNDNHETGRVIAVNPDAGPGDQVFEVATDWGTRCLISGVTVGATSSVSYLAWAYRDDEDCSADSGVIRRIALDGATSSQVLKEVAYDYPMPIQSPTAPGDEAPLLFYNRGNGSFAGAVDISGGDAGFELESAAWLGQIWETTLPPSGRQAEYLFYFKDDEASRSLLTAREATDTTGDTAVTFENAPDPETELNRNFGNVHVASFGPTTLLGIRPFSVDGVANLQGFVWYADPRDAESMQEVRTDSEYTSRPVAWF